MTIRLYVHGERESGGSTDPEKGRFFEVHCLNEPFSRQRLGMAAKLDDAYNKAQMHDEQTHQGRGQVLICSHPILGETGIVTVALRRLLNPQILWDSAKTYPPPAPETNQHT